MLLDIRALRGDSEEIVRRYQPDAFPPAEGDFKLAEPVDLTIRVAKDSQKVRLTGRVRTSLECNCSRCLEAFRVPVDAEIDQLLLPAGAEIVAPSKDDEDDDGQEADAGVTFYKNETIDLGELMRDEFYLALPMKPLCRPDCKGLCPECGVNWNRETCTCKREWVDPRLESLRTLLKHDD
jgi:uncharacterized protein